MLDSVKAILKTISPSSQEESTPSGSPRLEQYLKDIAPYASQATISLMDTGWYAWATLHTPAIGASLKVQSEILDCPYKACQQLHERVMAVLRPGLRHD